MRSATVLIAIIVALLLSARTASAQNATVQQPVFNNFSVGTTVSVPDRGGAYIGGVSRAGESRRSFGPLRSGSSFGLFREHAGVSAHVTIHDFGEMDRLILQQGEPASAGRPRMTGNLSAAHAYSSLIGRHSFQSSAMPQTARASSRHTASPALAESAARSFRLGQQAEARDNVAVARLHYRMAARHGSASAQARLDVLGGR